VSVIVGSFEGFEPVDKTTGFWKWGDLEDGGYGAILDVDAVIQNTMANMRRLEENATLNVVIDFLRTRGYIVIGPDDEGP
jgi:hypothetical protein